MIHRAFFFFFSLPPFRTKSKSKALRQKSNARALARSLARLRKKTKRITIFTELPEEERVGDEARGLP